MKEKTIALVRRVLKSELITGSSYLFVGTMIGNVLAFIFNLFLVRHLSFASYAEINAIISLITLVSIPAQAFLPTIVQFAAKYLAKNQTEHASELFWQANFKIGAIAVVLFVSFFLFSPFIGNFLHITNNVKLILAGAIVAAMYISVTNTAFLQSMLRFRFLSLTITLGGLLKLLLGIAAVTLGFGTVGILFGYLLTFLIPFLISCIPLRFLIYARTKQTIHSKEIVAYALPTALAIFSLSSFTSTDILLVKHFFPTSSAALYSGLSLVGRIIFYFTAPISSVMFPLVIKRISKGENAHSLLYGSFLLVLLPSLCLTIFYVLFPNLVISLVLGKQYYAAAPLLGLFGFYLCIFSLLNIAVNFLLSIKKTNVSWVIFTGALLQAIGITFFHTSLIQIVWLSLFLSLVLFAVLLLYYQHTYGSQQNQTE